MFPLRYVFYVFLGIHLLGSVALAMDSNSFNMQIEKNETLKTEIDSTEIYQNLIAEENLDANYTPNIVGIVFGSGFTGIGTFFLVGGIVGVNYSSNDAGDEIGTNIAGILMTTISVPFLVVGIPLLAYNIYQYNVRKSHAEQRYEYQDALNRYKRKREETSLQITFLPSVNFANNATGLNAIVAF